MSCKWGFFVHSRPCMRGPPLQVAGLPLVHPLRWEVRWELLLLLLLLPPLGLRLLLEPATASIAWLRRKETHMPSAPGVAGGPGGLKGYENGNSKAEKGSPTSMEKKDDIRKNGGISFKSSKK